MTINAFVQSPTKTILKVGKDAQGREFLEIREKGLWTWFLSNILCLSSYQLETVSHYVKHHYEDLGMDSLDNPQVEIEFCDILNDKIKRYNSHYPNRNISAIEKKVEDISTPIFKKDDKSIPQMDDTSTLLMKDQNSTPLGSPGDISSKKPPQDIEEFDFTNRDKFADAEVIKNLPPGLKRLHLAWREGEVNNAALKDLPIHLEELTLTSSKSQQDCSKHVNLSQKEIEGLPRGLKGLTLITYILTDEALKGLPKDLKKLSLFVCNFTDTAIQDLHKDLKDLEELTIVSNHELTDAALKNLPGSLKKLTLMGCKKITKAAVEDLFTNLEVFISY